MTAGRHIVNGVETDTVLVQDRGFSYGDGCFETIAIRNGRPLLWSLHMNRLRDGCARLGIRWNFGAPDLEAACGRLAGTAERAVIRVTVTRGVGGRGYRPTAEASPTWVASSFPWPDGVEEKRLQGVALTWCEMVLSCNPRLAGIKHLNRLEQVLARSEWGDEFEEGLMCDAEGGVREGTMSNVFFIENGILRTPALADGGINGIMRDRVMRAARDDGLTVEEGRYTPENLNTARAVFVTNSIIGIWPVTRLDNKSYSLHPTVTRLQHVISDAVA
jgi:4-amino-4-deoxychorismate lyase